MSFKYDVAFSFLHQDESVATDLNILLEERLTTFLYSKRQEELGGTDGETVFGGVFRKEARVVVVLYREGWGQTPWTRIEETSIRNRAFEEGYDFALFVPLDNPPTVPQWLPKTRIWIGLDRWGLEAAAAVIEARVQEVGGEPKPETARVKAQRLKADRQYEARRETFLKSEKGVEAAKSELAEVYRLVDEITDEVADPGTQLTFRKEIGDLKLALYSNGYSITADLALQWRNTLDQSVLYVTTWKGAIRMGRGTPITQPKELIRLEVEFDIDRQDRHGWRFSDGRFRTSSELADFIVQSLLESIGSRQ